jgi:hypothetical protein
MIKAVFQTADGCFFPSRSQAAKHEASIAISMHIRENCKGGDDDLYDEESVTNYLLNYPNEITRLVKAYQDSKGIPNYSKEDVTDWVILKLHHANEFVGAPRSGFLEGIVARVWAYLTSENPSATNYSEMEAELCERAWDHFEGKS